MNNPIALEYPAPANRVSLAAYLVTLGNIDAGIVAKLAPLTTALAGNPLGEGVEGVALTNAVAAALVACGVNNAGLSVTTGNTLPAGVSEGDEFNYDQVTLSLADFVALVAAALKLDANI